MTAQCHPLVVVEVVVVGPPPCPGRDIEIRQISIITRVTFQQSDNWEHLAQSDLSYSPGLPSCSVGLFENLSCLLCV